MNIQTAPTIDLPNTDPHVEWHRRCCDINDEINADPENDQKVKPLLEEFHDLEIQLIEKPASTLAGIRAQIAFFEMEFGRYLNDVAPSEPTRMLKTLQDSLKAMEAQQ